MRDHAACRLTPSIPLHRAAQFWMLFMCEVLLGMGGPANADESEYHRIVAESKPIARWSFTASPSTESWSGANVGESSATLPAEVRGRILREASGPTRSRFPLFAASNDAIWLDGQSGSLRFDDPGDESAFDFGLKDEITIEAWVSPEQIPLGQQVYIVGKGRTGNEGTKADNQNWALRLRNVNGSLRVSFLYRGRTENGERFHRWNSNDGVLAESGWHHIVFTYQFEDVQSGVAYIDSKASQGTWDMGGDKVEPPVVDNDQIWVGSSMRGNAAATFRGGLDEIAVYRRRLSSEEVAGRYRAKPVPPPIAVNWDEVPAGKVHVQNLAPLADASWNASAAKQRQQFLLSSVGFARLPRHYDDRGQITAPPALSLVRAAVRRPLSAGKYRFVVRAKNATRLYVNGKLIGEQGFMARNASGHEEVPQLLKSVSQQLPPISAGHREFEATVEVKTGVHKIRVDTIVGGKGLRAELGEFFVAWAAADDSTGEFYLLSPESSPLDATELSRRAWLNATRIADKQMTAWEQQQRQERYASDDDYWQQRHDRARDSVESTVDSDSGDVSVRQRINAMTAAGVWKPVEIADLTYLRRLSLDTVGVVPTRSEIADYLKQPKKARRQWAIDRYLHDPRWADHWVAYWQDVLAENPGILKPKLNNTGPFRWWIHESFLDNKPFDRFVTDLIMMGGNEYAGGPAGFRMATENDVPMAAKAHVLGQAFLGIEMKCARCHDAPYHPFQQNDLFEVAAMLQRDGIKLPSSSSVPARPDGRQPAVESSLSPGDVVTPKWPFAHLVGVESAENWAQDPSDPRQQLASLITAPDNKRFAQVVVNRLWKRYVGWGFVEPVDDWTDNEVVRPELLELLADELVRHNYDLKHVARLIFETDVYHRAPVDNHVKLDRKTLVHPLRRRMTAEQIVDSLYVISGKSMDCEPLTLDPEGRRAATTFLNLGSPTRSWQLTGLSNERDRPALALPVAQSIVDVLLAYGWRDARPNPITERDETATVLQPMVLANGIVGNRACRLSDNSRITELCYRVATPSELAEELFLRVLSRRPTDAEAAPFVELLSSEFSTRRTAEFQYDPFVSVHHSAVSWSNHLSAEATRIKLELERKARDGDPPTSSLDTTWREGAEDALWALLNSPEFVFIP